MTWKANLRPASLGGVQFHCSDRGLKTGRALVKHEYAKRNSPYTEDMGKDTWGWSVDAYVIGDDYMSRRDALVARCNREGVVQYTDHWGRNGVVRVESCNLKETSEEGRLARLQIELVEAGSEAGGLTGIVATAAVLAGASGGLMAAGVLQFAAAGVVGQSMPALSKLPGLSSLEGLAGGVSSAARSAASLTDLAPGLATAGNVTQLAQQAAARVAGSVVSVPLPQFTSPLTLPVR